MDNVDELLDFTVKVVRNPFYTLSLDDYQTIDTDNFQLTRSLILGAVCQAYKTDTQKPGFIELDSKFQKALEQKLES